jgi:ABC-type multidrug transport system fused ATPase/permease subunit
MNCIEHEDRNAIAACGRCNVGLCKDCEANSFFRLDNNQALCKKCNYEIGYENDRLFQSALKARHIMLGIYAATLAIGLIAFAVMKISGEETHLAVYGMLLCWGFGSFGQFFDKQPGEHSIPAKMKRGIAKMGASIVNSRTIFEKLFALIGTIMGMLLGFLILGLTSPIMIIALFIGINKVKKQIADNNAILSQLEVGNN